MLHKIMAAIDLGATYSGYLLRHEFHADPLKINCTNHFHTWSDAKMSFKTPSCILFSPDEQFHSFGYEAEDKYNDLLLDGEHQDWYYLHSFKMLLYSSRHLRRDMNLQTSDGKPFPAIKIFSSAINYLVNHTLSAIGSKLAGVGHDDVHWVITVPANWDEQAKHFMRMAAELAGIKMQNLSIALEPEVASIYCMPLQVEKLSDSGKSEISCFEPGEKYILVDMSGGTVNITVHEVLHDGHCRELIAIDVPGGGKTIDEAYKEFLVSLCGQKTFGRFKRDSKDDFIDLFQELEVKKRTVSPELDQKVNLMIPIILHEAFQDDHGKSVHEVVAERQDLQGKLVFAGDKMRMEPSLMESFFQEACDRIICHLKDPFSKPELSGVAMILMVGGFSESPMLHHVIQTAFSRMRVVIPNETSLVVLKGGVIYGHQLKIISSRVGRYTYGTLMRKPAWDGDPKELLIQVEGGRWMYRGHFSKHVEVGEEIPVGELSEGTVYIPYDKKAVFVSDLVIWENSSVAEKQVVQALRTATGRQAFSSQAKKHLGLEFREAHNGSIIIRFCPKVGKSLQKVKQSCATGKIKEFLPSIFMHSGVEHTLGEGNFRWKFSIYKTCRPIYFSAQETASPVVRMVNEECVIKDHWKLLEEEIDPWTLLRDLQMKGLVGEEDGDKMLKIDSRKDSVKFLLERLQASEEPDIGYEVLLDHCREHNDYLYQKILVTEGLQECCGYVEKRSETERCQSEQEMLFTATVILGIRRKEKNPKQYGSHVKLEISHLTIQEPVCYFDIEAEAPEEESDAADLQKEVVMVLEQVL